MNMANKYYESPQLEVLFLEVESPILEVSNNVNGPGTEYPD